MHVHHVDVTGAFLYGDLDDELYMSLLPRFEYSDHPDYVCNLKKASMG
jgi:Reverse transcriptase (RNA-dependent DNA polymerase)